MHLERIFLSGQGLQLRFLWNHQKIQQPKIEIVTEGLVHKLLWQVFGLFWPPTRPFVYTFYLIKFDIFWLSTYPPLLVNLVCERPLRVNTHCSKNMFLNVEFNLKIDLEIRIKLTFIIFKASMTMPQEITTFLGCIKLWQHILKINHFCHILSDNFKF